MDAFVIHGGKRLRGTVRINGSKNAALPLMAAALLTDEPLILSDVPNLADTRNMMKLLGALGCQAEASPSERELGRTVSLHAQDTALNLAHYDIVRTMRASICVLGPMLAKRGQAKVSMPGGCNIGDRPVGLHIEGLRALGARIHLDEGYIVATAPAGGRLRGAKLFLGGPFGSTVLGTANVMSAATLAQGTTIIESAACEPEVVDLANLLNAMGAQITGAGGPRITIEGVDQLNGATYRVMPDRIEAGTYILASAITNGEAYLENCPTDALTALLDRLRHVGVEVEVAHAPSEDHGPNETTNPTANTTANTTASTSTDYAPGLRDTVRVASSRRLNPTAITTQPHPGFPTDLQAQMMALLCVADGNSIITEKIFPDRFLHVAELLRMGANLTRSGPTVLVSGVRELIGAPVMASDLRASAGLVIAGLAARGATTINRVYHLDRGYEKMELTLQALGADIERVDHPAV